VNEKEQMIEGVAAQLYWQSGRHCRGWWWSVLNEELRQEWRDKARAELEAGRIAGLV